MREESPLAVVEAWQAAANNRDVASLLALSSPNIEIAGPRGSGYGHQLLCEWLERAGLRLQTLRAFVRGNVVVLSQHAVWRAVATGELLGEQDIASAFRVEDRRVTWFARFDSLLQALEATGLGDTDEVGW